jgi:tetratricopeptide (TPR) repeat protein
MLPPVAQSAGGAAAEGATGFFVPAEAAPPAETPLEGGTGIYVPSPTDPAVDRRAAGPGRGARPPASDATGFFVPDATDALGAGIHGGGGRQEQPGEAGATGVYTAGAEDGGTGIYREGGEPDTGGTGAFDSSAAPAEDEEGPEGPGQPGGAAAQEARCGRYVLERFVAKGGMGEIWLAEDPAIGRSVALKRMLGNKQAAQARFVVEAQITGQLEHPGIVPIHELGTTPDGQPFYTMKFVRGRTLKDIILEYHAALKKDGRPREVEELRLLQNFVSLCQTVAYAHSRGVLHRDLKPENVMLGSYGETLVLDWGIAKVLGQPEAAPEVPYVHLQGPGRETETRVGAIMGSPSYMAPEVAAGLNDRVDQVSDVYLLGATLYEILTGVLPRRAKTVMELIKKAQSEPPVPPRQINRHVSRPLEAICLKAMALRKEDRYQSALELADDVQRCVAGEPVSAYREGLLARAWRWARRHRTALTRAAVAAAFLVVVAAGTVALREAERRRQEAAREAAVLRRQEQARAEVKEFRRLADVMHYYAATTDAMSENAPYFDPAKGEATGRAALDVADAWGPDLEALPLAEERGSVKKELYDLLLLIAQVRSTRVAGPDDPATRAAAGEQLALLDRAALLGETSRGSYRLRAQAHRVLGEGGKADEEQRRADDPRTPATALDHFLLGEHYRQEIIQEASSQTEADLWERNRAGLGRAIAEYREAVRLDPQQFWSQFQIGRCSLTLRQGPEAVEALTACVALRPDSPWGYSMRGLVLGELNRYAEAEENLSRAIELDPDFRPARLSRGVVYWLQKKKDDAALADFDAVLQPPDAKVLIEAAFYRGKIRLQHGEVDKALEDFDRVARARPDFRRVYPVRAQIYLARGKDAQALEDFNTYLALGGPFDPKSAAAHAQRARLLRFLDIAPVLQEKKVALALADLDEALRLGLRSADLFDDLGALLEQAGRVKEAIQAYSNGLKQRPDDRLLLLKRGWAWEAVQEHDKAREDFTSALRVAPDNAEAHTGLGYVRAVGKRPAEAQREADLALLTGSDNYMILHNVACIYATLAQSDRVQAPAHEAAAVAVLRRALDLWKRGGAGPSEIDLIKGESAFGPSLRQRPDFQELLRGAGS